MAGSWRRRALTVPVVGLALPVLVLTAPLWIVLATIVDLVAGLRKLPSLRLGAFAVVYLAHEWVGITAFAVITAAKRLGVAGTEPTATLRRFQGWWASSLLRWAGRLTGLRLDLPDLATFPADGFILLSRHASPIDALIPCDLLAGRLGRYIHYVMKRELRWVPNIDLYGTRLGNYFIARDGDSDREIASIARFAAGARPGAGLVIFPEGTYATARVRDRVEASLRRRGETELADLAATLRHLLPPRPAGTLAILAARPELDVVVLGHVGLEGVGRLADLRRTLPLTAPVTVRWWHHPRSELPTSEQQLIDWLNDQWLHLDTWVDGIHHSHDRPGGHP